MNTQLKIAFIASLVLNVLLLGIFFGTLSPGFGRESSRRERLTAEIEKLPEPARSRFLDKMAQLRAAEYPVREEIRQARNEAIEILIAEPFDEPRYAKQSIKINQLRGQMSKRVADDLKALVRELPPEQRAAVGEMLKRPPPSPK
jgi:uncharacterized membrane protein